MKKAWEFVRQMSVRYDVKGNYIWDMLESEYGIIKGCGCYVSTEEAENIEAILANGEDLQEAPAEEAQEAQETMIDVTDILNTLDLGDYAEELNNYRGSSSYICDAIQEIADSNTSIYYSDIAKYVAENMDTVTDAINEFGWDGCGNDLYKAGQTAEYMAIEREIWDHSEDAIAMLAVNVLAYDMDMKIIPESLWDEVNDRLGMIDCNSRFDEIDEAIADIVGGEN